MNTLLTREIRAIMENIMMDCQLSGLSVAVGHDQQPIEYVTLGTDAADQPLTENSLFPVASITKLATALVVLRLVDQGALALPSLLETYLPEAAAAQAGVTLRNLLTHTSGLPMFYAEGFVTDDATRDWPKSATACLQTPLATSPNIRVAYSNVGYGLLAMAVERVTGQTFATALTDLVIRPLAIEAYLGSEPPRSPAVIADPYDTHAGTPLEYWNTPFFRSLAEPWTGMVMTQAAAINLLRAFQGLPGGFLRAETAAAATQDQTGGLGGGLSGWLEWPRCPWGLGPELRGQKTPHVQTSAASPASFGHSGLTGALVWCDPTANLVWAINGTRTSQDDWQSRAFPPIGTALLAAARKS